MHYYCFLEINKLRHIIYDTAAGLKKQDEPVMGELIPCSFFSLIERLEKRKMEMLNKKQPPIIRREEFKAMVEENSRLIKKDIEDTYDMTDATVFLRERGNVVRRISTRRFLRRSLKNSRRHIRNEKKSVDRTIVAS